MLSVKILIGLEIAVRERNLASARDSRGMPA